MYEFFSEIKTKMYTNSHSETLPLPAKSTKERSPYVFYPFYISSRNGVRKFVFLQIICDFNTQMKSHEIIGIDRPTFADNRTTQALLLIMVFAGALFLRLYHLEAKSLWNDEMFSLRVAGSPVGAIQGILAAHYHHPPLFFYITHLFLKIFGENAWALRLPSAISGALTIPLLYAAGKKFFNVTSGFTCAILCLAAPFHVAYSQEGRPYALAGLLCLLSAYYFILCLRSYSAGRTAGFLLATTALLYTHHWGLFVVAAEFLVCISIVVKDRSLLMRWILTFGVLAVCYLPEFIAFRQQVAADSPAAWFWVEHPGFRTLLQLGTAFSGTFFRLASSSFVLPVWLQILSLLYVGSLIILALLDSLSTEHSISLLLLFLAAIIIAIPLCVSFVKPEVFVWYRYPVIAFPLFCIAVGGMKTDSVLSRHRFLLIILSVVINLIALNHYYGWEKGNAKEVAGYVQGIIHHDTDFIIRPKEFAPLFNYYYTGDVQQLDETYLDQPLGDIVDTARSFIYISLDVPNTIRDYMDGHFVRQEEKVFPGEAHMGIVIGSYIQKPESND